MKLQPLRSFVASRWLDPAIATFVVLALFTAVRPAAAQMPGQVQGRVIAKDTGEPVSFANVALIPADTTQKKTGGLTNSDGTFRIPVPAGLYSLLVQAISYTRKRVTGVRVEAGKPTEISVVLEPEALLQQEIVVEARAASNTEAAILAQRKKADSVGDAVSAEQVRKSPDKDAAEVLRRVTGISVADGKYVYVRGLGERYSSTEVDGVRLVSPEQNKRIVPLDMLPASLLENVVIQKTYTADRPGEFGGGDVQVHTKDFPGQRTFQVSFTQEYDAGTSFENIRSYSGSNLDWIGNGAGDRGLPAEFLAIAGDKPVVPRSLADPAIGFSTDTLAMLGNSFDNVWSPTQEKVGLNGNVFQTYGDEWTVLGKPLGFVQSLQYRRSRNSIDGEQQRFYTSEAETLYNYDVERSTQTVQIGGMAGFSYRLAPNHSVHLRGLYSRNSDDEVRFYQGFDENDLTFLRANRLLYTQRSIATGGLEGRHEFPSLLRSRFDWKANLSGATLKTPDRRETVYEYTIVDYDENDQPVYNWALSGDTYSVSREFGDQKDNGFGLDGKWAVPLRLFGDRNGSATAGVSYQEKDRNSTYRRFEFLRPTGVDETQEPESLFSDPRWTGNVLGARISERTRADDSYFGTQEQTAGFVSVDLPLTTKLRGVLGVRVEHGVQDVTSYDLFQPDSITTQANLDDVDWLPAVNLNYALTEKTNVRAAASRTLSRPDLRELAPALNLELIGGIRTAGNPDLIRARLDNYDLRVETFPALGEVFAAGVFYKQLHDPIERVITGGDAPILIPENSESGRNYGLELEARSSLARISPSLRGFFLNTNLAWIDSEVKLRPRTTVLGTEVHPLQGQPELLFNGGLGYTSAKGGWDASVLLSYTGKRLESVGLAPRPDVYDDGTTTLDATVNARVTRVVRMKVSAKNMFDTEYVSRQGDAIVSSYQPGRSFSVGISYAP
jgi:outer membrane receptor protein involved in Fe transport